jgi:hypothetical protein
MDGSDGVFGTHTSRPVAPHRRNTELQGAPAMTRAKGRTSRPVENDRDDSPLASIVMREICNVLHI